MDRPPQPPVTSAMANTTWPCLSSAEYCDSSLDGSAQPQWLFSSRFNSKLNPDVKSDTNSDASSDANSDTNSSSNPDPSPHFSRVSRSTTTTRIASSPLSPLNPSVDMMITSSDADSNSLTASSSLPSLSSLDILANSSPSRSEISTSPASLISRSFSINAFQASAIDKPEDLEDVSLELQWDKVSVERGDDFEVEGRIAKLEPADEDDFRLEDVKEAPEATVAYTTTEPPQLKAKRPRGRPRKPGSVNPSGITKINNGRSKTGCITCRRRKKKCDETKPVCLNCKKNAVICEGYPEKQIWKSGKEKAREDSKNDRMPVITMQPIFPGLEKAEDRVFWKHYNDYLSSVFTVEKGQKGAFREILVPLATRHQGMMHSILSLSSKHLNLDAAVSFAPTSNKNVTVELLRERGKHHNMAAVSSFNHAISEIQSGGVNHTVALEAHYGQILCLALESLTEGIDTERGEGPYPYYKAFLYLIKNSPPPDPGYRSFIVEIFYYHIFADDLLWLPQADKERTIENIYWTPPTGITSPRLIGVADGLLDLLSEVTTIRSTIRERLKSHSEPTIDYDSLYRSTQIEGNLADWSPDWPIWDSRYRVALLYKQMAWLYIKTTMCSPTFSPVVVSTVAMQSSVGSTYTVPSNLANTDHYFSSPSKPTTMVLDMDSSPEKYPHEYAMSDQDIPSDSDTSVISADLHGEPTIQMVTSAATPTYESTQMQAQFHLPEENSDTNSNSNSSNNSSDGDNEEDTIGIKNNEPSNTNEPRSSPEPIRRPLQLPGLSLAVDECLRIIEWFEVDDPAQTVFLLPCVVIGTACYTPHERNRVCIAVQNIHNYTGLSNTSKVVCILHEIWRLMDKGEYLLAWDWQAVAHRLGINFLF